MTARYFHLVQVGTFEMKFYGRDDRYVRRVVARWLTLCWEKAKASQRKRFPGSMGTAIDDGWHGPPTILIGRWLLGAGDIIPCCAATIIEEFPAEPDSVQEFCRAYGRAP